MKTITQKIDNNYSGKTDKQSIKKLFIMGYNISQIQWITTAKVDIILKSIDLKDIVKRSEKIDFSLSGDLLNPVLNQITGIEWRD